LLELTLGFAHQRSGFGGRIDGGRFGQAAGHFGLVVRGGFGQAIEKFGQFLAATGEFALLAGVAGRLLGCFRRCLLVPGV
jgi:hypothetical protein